MCSPPYVLLHNGILNIMKINHTGHDWIYGDLKVAFVLLGEQKVFTFSRFRCDWDSIAIYQHWSKKQWAI